MNIGQINELEIENLGEAPKELIANGLGAGAQLIG
jgi:hypothetical protein